MPTTRVMRTISISLLAALFGCGDGTFASAEGTMNGEAFTPESFFWGGPFLVLSNKTWECEDFAWVKRGSTFTTGDEPPVDEDMKALLFTYNQADTDVTAGNFSVEGEAPVDARGLEVSGSALNVYRAETGSLIVDEINKKDQALGSFDLGFDDGQLTGEFQVDWCTNLTVKG